MRIGARDKWWLLGGLVVALLLLGVAWQFFVSSQNSKTDSLKSQTQSAQDQQLDQRRQLNRLKADSVNLKKYQDALASARAALPTTTGIPDFLRDVHAAGDRTGVEVLSIAVSPPVAVPPAAAAVPTTGASTDAASGTSGGTTDSGLYQMSISVTATGITQNVTDLLKQLQETLPRAVLITSVVQGPGSGAGRSNVTIAMYAFVAPADGATPSLAPTAG